MTVGQFLAVNVKKLASAGIETARLDCLVLLEDELGAERASLLAHAETKISPSTEVILNTKIAQRATHMPLAYIRGKAMFYGRLFHVSPAVLVPRPESESIITLLKTLPLPAKPHILDIGTGSGCLGITAALEIPNAQVWLCDIDNKALVVAKQNAEEHPVNVRTAQSDLLEQVKNEDFVVLLANLPYISDTYTVNQAARHEPKLALFAGRDGLDLYRRLWLQIAAQSEKPAFVITESLLAQHDTLVALASSAGYELLETDGLVQCLQLVGRRRTERHGN